MRRRYVRGHAELRGLKLVCCAAFVTALGACGGSGESASPIPVRAGSADVDAAGGSVDAVLEGGTQVTLTVPAGALATKTTLTLDPQPASTGTLGAVQVSPAGLQFRLPASLVVTLPVSGAAASANQLVLVGDGALAVPIASIVGATAHSLSVDLSYLGHTSDAEAAASRVGAPGRARALDVTPSAVTLVLQQGDFNADAALLQTLVANLASSGSRDNAIDVELAMTAILPLPPAGSDARVLGAVATWRGIACAQQQSAVSALATFDFASDYRGFISRVADALIFGQLSEQVGKATASMSPSQPGCANLPSQGFTQPVRDVFAAYMTSVRRDLGMLDPQGDFIELLRTRLPQLLDFVANLQTFIGSDDLAASVQNVAADQTVRLRAGAYSACRSGIVAQSFQQDLLKHKVGDPGFEPLAPYSDKDIINDIENCGMPIFWVVQDAGGNVLQQGPAAGNGPGAAIGAVLLRLAGASKVVLKGPLKALGCPSGSANNEQLSFAAGPAAGSTTSVGVLTPANDTRYLESSNLELTVAQLQTLAQPGNGKLTVMRTGATCNGDFPTFDTHSVLVNFTLDFSGLAIRTSSLPDAIVGSAYVAQLLSIGGAAPLAWSATGLPSGLGIDAQTGVISGTPAAAGAATVLVTVQSEDGASAQSTLVLQVGPRVSLWQMAINYSCGGLPGSFSTGTGVFDLTENGDQLGGTFRFPTLGGGSECPSSAKVSSTLTAVTQRNAGQDIVALTTLVVTTTIDASAVGGTVCVDTPIAVPGPIAASGNQFVQVLEGDQSVRSKCFSGHYVSVQLFKKG